MVEIWKFFSDLHNTRTKGNPQKLAGGSENKKGMPYQHVKLQDVVVAPGQDAF